ncbi:MAG: hypothetical protein PHH91_00605 [Desulfuromonadaceae bacterium]|nr:hypothetical protein [Desulfuromonadaceae bacterium]
MGARIFLKKVLRWLLVNLAIGFDTSSASDIVAVMQNEIISKQKGERMMAKLMTLSIDK